MSAFVVTRENSFHPPEFSMALYHCPLPSLEVRSIYFVYNGSISVEYLRAGAGCKAETAVATAVVIATVRLARNAASTALGISGAVTLSSLSVFVAESSDALLFVRLAIVQSS